MLSVTGSQIRGGRRCPHNDYEINVYPSCQGLKSSTSAEFSRSDLFERPEEQKFLSQYRNLQGSWIAEILSLNFHRFAPPQPPPPHLLQRGQSQKVGGVSALSDIRSLQYYGGGGR